MASIAVTPTRDRWWSHPGLRFHAFMALGSAALCVAGLIVAPAEAKPAAIWVAVLSPLVLVPAAYRHSRGEIDARDATLTLVWLVVLIATIAWVSPPMSGLRPKLFDAEFAKLDARLGISVPAIAGWVFAHRAAERVAQQAYSALDPLIALGALLPALAGKRDAARRFVLSNLIAFAIGIPIYTIFPAIGPFVGRAFANSLQRAAQASAIALRTGGVVLTKRTVCLPSYHTIWAVLSSAALWPFRWLRWPAAILAALVVASTIATGWHYGADVIAGLAIAYASLLIADRAIAEKRAK